ncbi:N-acetyl-gamma-glutamyl-phosphate reductase, partial [Candidatus Geothermarchaeota archaeon]
MLKDEMMKKVGVIGGAGYVGGELLRILLQHPEVEVSCVTSRSNAGEYIYRIHPNLRGFTDLKFIPPVVSKITDKCDIVFSAAPHGAMVKFTKEIVETGVKVIDLSADYRLKDPFLYEKYYGFRHPYPDLLEKSVYGLPEIHRNEIKNAFLVACPGCTATSAILSLAPLLAIMEQQVIVVDAMEGSSAGGSSPRMASHHPERANIIRPYKPTG